MPCRCYFSQFLWLWTLECLKADRLFHFGGQPAIIHSFPAVEKKRKVNLLIFSDLTLKRSPCHFSVIQFEPTYNWRRKKDHFCPCPWKPPQKRGNSKVWHGSSFSAAQSFIRVKKEKFEVINSKMKKKMLTIASSTEVKKTKKNWTNCFAWNTHPPLASHHCIANRNVCAGSRLTCHSGPDPDLDLGDPLPCDTSLMKGGTEGAELWWYCIGRRAPCTPYLQ